MAWFVLGNVLIVLAFVCWLLDRFACETLSNVLPAWIGYPQLHAWWHLLAYGSVWCATVVGTYLRCLTAQQKPVLRQSVLLRLPYTDVLEV